MVVYLHGFMQCTLQSSSVGSSASEKQRYKTLGSYLLAAFTAELVKKKEKSGLQVGTAAVKTRLIPSMLFSLTES